MVSGEDSAAEEFFVTIKRHDLAGCESALGRIELDRGDATDARGELDRNPRVAITHTAFDALWRDDRRTDEAQAVHATFTGPQTGRGGTIERHKQGVVGGTLAYDDVRFVIAVGGNADPAS